MVLSAFGGSIERPAKDRPLKVLPGADECHRIHFHPLGLFGDRVVIGFATFIYHNPTNSGWDFIMKNRSVWVSERASSDSDFLYHFVADQKLRQDPRSATVKLQVGCITQQLGCGWLSLLFPAAASRPGA